MKNRSYLLLPIAIGIMISSLLIGIGDAKAQSDLLLDWAKSTLCGPKGGSDIGYYVALDGSGNTYITGYFNSTADFDPSAGTANLVSAGANDIFLAKYDASGNYLWSKAMGGSSSDYGYSVAVDGSGNAYITGYFAGTADFDPSAGTANLVSAGANDIFLAKYDASGSYVWAKNMGGTSSDIGNSVALDGSGNTYITGYFAGTADFDPSAGTANLTSAGSNDIFLAKYDANGNYLWAKNMGGTSSDNGNSVAVDGSGNAYITGYFAGTADFDPSAGIANLTSAGGNDIFLAKYDASGNYLLAKKMGGTSNDQGSSVAVDGSGNAHITGYFIGTADFDPSANTANLVSAGVEDIFLAKYDASGSYVWAKNMGGTSSDIGNSVALDGSGNTYITGFFYATVDFDPSAGTANLTSAGSNDIFLAKYDASGNYLWTKNMGGTSGDIGRSVAVDASGNAYITGYFQGTADFDPSAGIANLASAGNTDIPLAKYDASGNYSYAGQMGLYASSIAVNPVAVALDASGNAYITGYFAGTADFDPSAGTANLTSAGSADIFLAKYDASGNYIWAKNMGGTSTDIGYSVAVDASGNAYITGYFIGTADFDPSAATANLVSAGNNDIFLAKYNSSGTYLWAKNMGGASDDYGQSVAVDGSGNAYITGYFSGTADFDPSATTANLTSAGSTDIFLAKYNSSGTYLWAKNMGGTSFDYGRSVAVDASGNAYITGYFYGTADFDPSAATANLVSAGSADIFLAKYDASGNYVWAKNMGGTSSEAGNSVAVDGSSNAYITGFFAGTADFDPSADTANLTSAGGNDIFLAKYDASGNYVWAKKMGGTSNDYGQSVAVDGSGNAYITGYFAGTADFDPSAGTANLTSAGNADIFLAKYDASGNYLWVGNMGGTFNDQGQSVAVDASGNAYILGFFYNTADFDPSAGTLNLTAGGTGSECFVARYSSEPLSWIGTTNTDWNNTTNWAAGVVPTASDNVLISGFPTNQPHVTSAPGSPAQCADLTMEPFANLTIDAGKALTVSGNTDNEGTILVKADATGIGSLITEGTVSGSGDFQMEQYLTGAGGATPNGLFYYVSSPVASATSNVYSAAGDNKLWSANETTQSYSEITDNSTGLNVGQGYVARLGATATETFTGGAFSTGNQSASGLTRSGTSATNRGYNLVGNPYPSTVSWDAATKTNLETTMWYRTHQGSTMLYDTYNATGSVGTNNNGNGAVTGAIAPTQGFWVRVNADGNTGQLDFTNAMRSHGTLAGIYRMAAEEGTVRMTLSNGTNSDEAILLFDENASDDFDTYDSHKFWAAASVPQLYMNEAEDSLVINGLYSTATNPIVDLGVKLPTSGNYTLNANEITVVGETIHLEDRLLNIFQDLNAEPNYSFTSAAGNIGDRFALHFGMSVTGIGTDAINCASTRVYTFNGNTLNIILSENTENGNVQVLDMAGRIVGSFNLNANRTSVDMNVNAGIYLIRIQTEKGTDTHRIILN